jgi:hypothetical protein
MMEKYPYETDVDFDVRFAKRVTVGRFTYRPGDKVIAKGRLLNQVVEENAQDAIASANRR